MPARTSAFFSTLAVLLASRTVSAVETCVLNPDPPAGLNCGLKGYARNDYSFDSYSFNPAVVASPETCALACQERETCVSFYIGGPGYPFCEWHKDTTAASDFYGNPKSYYYGYDQACFTCGEQEPTCPGSDGQTYTSGASTFDIHCSTDYYGGDLNHYNVDNFTQCMDYCASSAGCEAVALNGNNCYLKSSVQPPRTDSSVWGAVLSTAEPAVVCPDSNGTTYTTANGEQFQIQCGADYYGNDLTAPYVNDFNDCLETCGSTSGCVGVALHGNYCYMKNALANEQQNSEVWGAALISTIEKRDQAVALKGTLNTPGLPSRRRGLPTAAKN